MAANCKGTVKQKVMPAVAVPRIANMQLNAKSVTSMMMPVVVCPA